MKCPPENCGGIRGYINILKAFYDPDHDRHEEIMVLLGKNYDPKFFDREEVNKLLKEKNFGCKDYSY